MSSKKLFAGVSLAALAACGLSVLSSPAFATPAGPGIEWAVVTGPGSTPVAGEAPVYAEQAIKTATSVTIPGYSSGDASPYGGITWLDTAYPGVTGGTGVTLTFTLPVGDNVTSCKGTGGVDGTSFSAITGFTTSANVITVVLTASSNSSTNAWYQLPPCTVTGLSGTILASYTANGGPTSFVENCPTGSSAAACIINASSSENYTTTGESTLLITSGNFLSLATNNQSNLICIDVLSDSQPGTEFQQPCGGIHANDSVYGDPTNQDGNHNGSRLTATINDPACSTAASEPQCGNGTVTGSVTNNDTLTADKGTLIVNETILLSANGIKNYTWANGFSNPPFVVTLTGLCAGLEGPIENIGSVTASCGMLPFSGETYVGLTPISSPGTAGSLAEDTGYAFNDSNLCPKGDDFGTTGDSGGQVVGSIVPVSGGAEATFNMPADGRLELSQTAVTTPFSSSNPANFLNAYYEVCDYASGNTILGPVSAFYVSVTFDGTANCATKTATDCTSLADGGNTPLPLKGQPADALLTYAFNGEGQLFQYTNGNSYAAYLRVVNLMQDYNPSTGATGTGTSGCTALDAASGPCEPMGAVVCKIWGDDGQNAYVTLWPNASQTQTPVQDGETTGTNYNYPVASLFAQGGITTSAANPYLLGSLLCFHNDQIHITQWWFEPNGTILNMQ